MINVWTSSLPNDEPIKHEDGKSIDVRDDGHLHVFNMVNKSVAIYAPGKWVRSTRDD